MTLQQLFIEATRKHAPLDAAVQGGRRLTYRDLARRTAAFSNRLRSIGVRRGETVGLMLPNSIEFIVAYYAVAAGGMTVVPLNPTLTADELSFICRDAGIRTLICHATHAGIMRQLRQQYPELQNLVVAPKGETAGENSFEEWMQTGDGNGAAFSPEASAPDDVAAILYTSGTTGKPKGAMLTQKNLFSNTKSSYETLGCSPSDCFLVALPLFHAFQATVGMLTPIMGGCKMVIAEEFKPSAIFELIQKEGLTVFLGVPSMYLLFTRALQGTPPPKKFFRLCVSGGAALPVAVAREFEKLYRVPIHEGYGLTEASPVCSVNPIDKPPRVGSIGVPLKGVELKVADENGWELPPGKAGELLVRGDNVMKGYHGLPEETAKTIRGGWLHTGDIAKRDEDGYFYIVDRKKEMIIVAGENVYPREVEEVLFTHPAVAEAAVVGAPDELRGEIPAAFIRLKENLSADKKEILAHCRRSLAAFKIPRVVHFIDTFPKNATGKILKKELRQRV